MQIITVCRVSMRDPLYMSREIPKYMSPLVKHLCKIRNQSIQKGDNEQPENRINTLIRDNMVTSVKNENERNASGSKKWWDTVNKVTKVNYGSLSIDPSIINSYFQKINTDDNYTPPELVAIPNGTRMQNVDVSTVEELLARQKKHQRVLMASRIY